MDDEILKMFQKKRTKSKNKRKKCLIQKINYKKEKSRNT